MQRILEMKWSRVMEKKTRAVIMSCHHKEIVFKICGYRWLTNAGHGLNMIMPRKYISSEFCNKLSLGTYKSRFRSIAEVKHRYFRLKNEWEVKKIFF